MAENRKPFDEAFKSLSEADPRGFLEVMGVLPRGVQAVVEVLPQEVSRSTVAIDTGLVVRLPGARPFIAVFEAFGRLQSRHLDQVVEYNKGLDSAYDFDQRTYMVPLVKRGCPADPPRRVAREKGGYGVFVALEWIRPWETDAGLLLAQGRPEFDAWTALCRSTVEQEREAVRRLRVVPNQMARFRTLAGLRYREGELALWRALVERTERMLTREDMRESLAVQEWLEEGRVEGRREAALEVLRNVLLRFPAIRLPDELPAGVDWVRVATDILGAPDEASARLVLAAHRLDR